MADTAKPAGSMNFTPSRGRRACPTTVALTTIPKTMGSMARPVRIGE